MGLDLQQKCAKCGKSIAPQDMRALDGGRSFVCKNCFEQTRDPSPFKKKSLRKPVSDDSQDTVGSSQSFFEHKEYICDDCGYRFKRGPEFVVGACPFCGKRNTVHQKIDQQAQELLED